ncbi:MAG: pilus assembly protein [Planctomycetes bacterium]|nr:pilus assembly protein [Planctomycetota bacterium]
MRNHRFSSQRKHRRRTAAIALELILALPVLFIGLFAVVEYAAYFSGAQQAALASRVGAEEASQIALPNEVSLGMPNNPGDPVPAAVVAAVLDQLGSAGISPCRIILEHNVNSVDDPQNPGQSITPLQVFVTSFGPCDCEPPDSPLPPQSVRVTVCLPMTEVVPNLLATFGFDVADKTVQQTTVFRHEL